MNLVSKFISNSEACWVMLSTATSPVDHTITQFVHLWGEKMKKRSIKSFEQEVEESKCLFIVLILN